MVPDSVELKFENGILEIKHVSDEHSEKYISDGVWDLESDDGSVTTYIKVKIEIGRFLHTNEFDRLFGLEYVVEEYSVRIEVEKEIIRYGYDATEKVEVFISESTRAKTAFERFKEFFIAKQNAGKHAKDEEENPWIKCAKCCEEVQNDELCACDCGSVNSLLDEEDDEDDSNDLCEVDPESCWGDE